MKKINLNIFELFSFFWITLSLGMLGALIIKIFNIWSISILTLLILTLITFLIKNKFIIIEKLDRFSVSVLISVIALGIFLSFLSTPTIFGGRDEGSYSSSAILIANQHKLTYKNNLIDEFFKIYGPGKALNFPGFYYTENGHLKSQFLPGYPSWLAIFYSIGGLKGIQFANLFPFVTFIFSALLSLRLILQKAKESKNVTNKSMLIAMSFFLTSFPLLVFYKFTLSEIYFASLCWFSLYLILKYLENKSFENYFPIFIPLFLIIFIRIEAIAIIFFFILIMILKDANHLQKPIYQIPFVLAGIFFVIAVYIEPNFFINSFKNIIPIDINQTGTINKNISTEKFSLSDDWKNFYTLKIFFTYNLLAIFAMAIAVIIKASLKFKIAGKNRAEKDTSKVNSYLLIPLVLFFPTLIYLFDANISLDHPWFLRRFVFSIIPLAIIYSAIFLVKIPLKTKLLPNLIYIIILTINISLLFPEITNPKENFLTFSQNKNLLNQIEKISKNFSPNDLVLISQQSSGSGWSLMSEPMRNIFGINAVYFFNPKDLEKIDLSKFDNIHLITSNDEIALYNTLNLGSNYQEYEINNNIINPSKNPNNKPQISLHKTSGRIYKIQK